MMTTMTTMTTTKMMMIVKMMMTTNVCETSSVFISYPCYSYQGPTVMHLLIESTGAHLGWLSPIKKLFWIKATKYCILLKVTQNYYTGTVYLLLEDIHTASRELVRVPVSKHMANSWTRNDFHATSTLPYPKGDFCFLRDLWNNIKIGRRFSVMTLNLL